MSERDFDAKAPEGKPVLLIDPRTGKSEYHGPVRYKNFANRLPKICGANPLFVDIASDADEGCEPTHCADAINDRPTNSKGFIMKEGQKIGGLLQFDPQALINRMFRRADDVVWDLSTGSVGIATKEGIATLSKSPGAESGQETYGISLNLIDSFAMPIPAFAQSVPFSEVKRGVIVHGASDVLGWVDEVKERQLKIIKPNGQITQWSPPKVETFGVQDGVMVVKPLLDFFGGNADGVKGLQSNLIPMMMMAQVSGNNSSDGVLNNIMPLLLFQQVSGGKADMSGMMPLLMMQAMSKGAFR
jgi:hypothetical protein